MDRKKLALAGAGIALLAGAWAAVGIFRENGIAVQMVPVLRERIQAKVSASGHIHAVQKVDVSANIMGKVTRLAVKEGDAVKAGQFLLEIDPSLSKAIVEGSEASLKALGQDLEATRVKLDQAKKDFVRAESNRRAGIISQAEHDNARATLATAETMAMGAQRRVEQAKAGLSQSQVGLNYATLTSPMDGVVTAKRIERGETVVIGVQNQPGTVLLTISDMSKVEAEMEVDEAAIPSVKLGQKAEIRIDAYANKVFTGEVTEVGGSPILKANVNEAIKFKVKVWVKNPPLTIKPGLSAQADIFTGSREDAVAVPIQALVTREIQPKAGQASQPGTPRDEEGVFVAEAGKCRFVPVKTGLIGDLNIEVLEGLKGGEQVITGPFKALRDLKGGEQVRQEKKKIPDDVKA